MTTSRQEIVRLWPAVLVLATCLSAGLKHGAIALAADNQQTPALSEVEGRAAVPRSAAAASGETGPAVAANAASAESAALQLADQLEGENENLQKLQDRLAQIEEQMSAILEARRQRDGGAGSETQDRLANAPDSFATKTLSLHRTVSDNDLIYTVSARNAPVLQILEGIAKTAALSLDVHPDIGANPLAGRISLELHGADILELAEIVVGTQSLDATIDDSALMIGPITALSDRPIEERLREMAVTAYHRALFRYPGSADAPTAYLGISRYHQATGFYAAAIQTAQSILERYPDCAACGPALLMIASCHEALNRREEARNFYHRYVDSYPAAEEVPAVMVNIGETWAAEGKWSQAIPILEEVARDYPDSDQAPVARIGLAKCLAAENRYEPALAQLKIVEENHPNFPRMNDLGLLIAESLMKLKHYGPARVRLRKIIREAPSPFIAERAYYTLGDIFLGEGDAVAALEMYYGAMTNFAAGMMRKTLPFRICRAYIQMGLFVKIEEMFRDLPEEVFAAEEMRPIIFSLAQYHLGSGSYGRVMALMNDPRWPHDEGTDPEVLILLGKALLGEGRLDEALAKATAAARFATDDALRAEAYLLIGECHRLRNPPAGGAAAARAYAGEIE